MAYLQLVATITNGIVAVLCVMILLRQRKIMKMYRRRNELKDRVDKDET